MAYHTRYKGEACRYRYLVLLLVTYPGYACDVLTKEMCIPQALENVILKNEISLPQLLENEVKAVGTKIRIMNIPNK